MLDPYEIIFRDGKKVDRLTDGALKRAEKILGRKIPIVQGSYNPLTNTSGVKASGGTHDEGGVADTKPWDADETIIALRAVGFAAWHRPAIPDLWAEHIHMVLIGHGRLSPAAARQVEAYLQRRDGLRSNLIDTDPGWTNIARYTVESFRADLERERIDATVAEKRAKIEANKAQNAGWRERIKVLLAKRKSLPK